MDRRKFLSRASVAGSVGVVGVSTLLNDAVAEGFRQMNELALSQFSGLVNDKFVVRGSVEFLSTVPGGKADLTLTESVAFTLSEMDDRRHEIVLTENGAPVRDKPFMLVFNAALGTQLDQATYRFEHARLGEFNLFIVPSEDPRQKAPSSEFYVATIN